MNIYSGFSTTKNDDRFKEVKIYIALNFLINYFSLLKILVISQIAIQFPLEKKFTSVQSRDIN